MPPVRAELAGAPTNQRAAKSRDYPATVRCPGACPRSHQVSDAPIRVDRAVPEIHHGMAAARAKPQVTGPDEFSAPTGGIDRDHPRGDETLGHAQPEHLSEQLRDRCL